MVFLAFLALLPLVFLDFDFEGGFSKAADAACISNDTNWMILVISRLLFGEKPIGK